MWKQPKGPSTDEWVKKMWYIYIDIDIDIYIDGYRYRYVHWDTTKP